MTRLLTELSKVIEFEQATEIRSAELEHSTKMSQYPDYRSPDGMQESLELRSGNAHLLPYREP